MVKKGRNDDFCALIGAEPEKPSIYATTWEAILKKAISGEYTYVRGLEDKETGEKLDYKRGLSPDMDVSTRNEWFMNELLSMRRDIDKLINQWFRTCIERNMSSSYPEIRLTLAANCSGWLEMRADLINEKSKQEFTWSDKMGLKLDLSTIPDQKRRIIDPAEVLGLKKSKIISI